MSISFWVPDAETKEVPCEYCKWEKEHHGEGSKCSPVCSGLRAESIAPSVNFSNMNAFVVMELMGVEEPDYCGCVEVGDLGRVQQHLLVALNKESHRSWAIQPSSDTGGPGTGSARMIYGGNTDDQTVRRLQAIQRVVTWAQENGCKVCWG